MNFSEKIIIKINNKQKELKKYLGKNKELDLEINKILYTSSLINLSISEEINQKKENLKKKKIKELINLDNELTQILIIIRKEIKKIEK